MSSRSRAPVESMTRGSSWGMNGSVTGSEPAAMIAESKETVEVVPSGPVTVSMFGEVKVPVPTTVCDFALFGQPGQAAGQPLHDAVFPAAQGVEVDGGGGEGEPGVAHLFGFGDDFGGVQEGFGGDAADVEADPAERAAGVDHDDGAAEVGGAEGGGVAAGSGAQDQDLGVQVAFLPGVGGGCADRGGSRCSGWAGPPTTRTRQAPSASRRARAAAPGRRRPGRRGPAEPASRRRWARCRSSMGSRAG